MNRNKEIKIKAELMVYDTSGIQPNFAALARKYDVDYRTIKKYHNGYEGKPKTRNKPSKLNQYDQIINEKLQIPRVSLKGVYEYLVDNYGLDKIGSYSNFKAYCKKNNYNTKIYSKGGNTRYETEPGDMAQCDWKEDIILISRHGEVFKVSVFHLLLKFSRYSYVELTISRDQNVVFRCLINAFKFFGGIPNRILFDNMSTIVDVNVRPKRINNKALQFAKDFNFSIETCKARHAYTKGSNEARNKMIDYLRAYNNEFDSYEDLVKLVEKLNKKMNLEICNGTDVAPCVLYYKEKEYLRPIVNEKVIDHYLSPAKVQVNGQQLILYKGSRYSVDKSYVNQYVTLEEIDDKLYIYYKGKLIQTHPTNENPINYTEEHYKQTLVTVEEDKIQDIAMNNLKVMDKLLQSRRVDIKLKEAQKSHEALLAYLIIKSGSNNSIRRIIYDLNECEKQVLFDEVTKLLPYVINESKFIEAFKYAVDKDKLALTRVNFWGYDCIKGNTFLSSEGHESIYNEFKNETIEYILNNKKEE